MKRDGLGQPLDPAGRYYLSDDRQVVGNCMLWWCPNGAGYTCELGKAGIYTGSEADHRDTDVPWPVDYVQSRVVVHVRRDRLRDGIPASQEPRAVIERLAARLGVPADKVRGSSRIEPLVRARHACMLALRRQGLSFPAIARELGGMDHSAVINGCKRAELRELADAVFARALADEAPPGFVTPNTSIGETCP